MKHLYFIRHGESEANVAYTYASRAASPLTARGRKQTETAGQKAAGEGLAFDIMLVSPLARAQQTADILQQFLSLPQREEYPLIIERDFSVLEGTSYRDRDQKSYAALDDIPGVETIADLQQRAEEVLAMLWVRPEPAILLVSHSAFGRALKRVIDGDPWQDEYRQAGNLPLPHAEILRFI